MAKSKIATHFLDDLPLSKRERRLAKVFKIGNEVSSIELCETEFSKDKTAWPFNSRTIITNVMRTIGRKLDRQGLFILVTNGGGRGGVKYQINRRDK